MARKSKSKSKSKSARPAARDRPDRKIVVERVQTGVRMEKRLLKVLKGLAEYHDLSLSDLLEGIVLHVFEGKLPLGEESLKCVSRLRRVYGLDLDERASHRMIDAKDEGIR